MQPAWRPDKLGVTQMDLRIMAVLAIILLVLAAACGPSAATVDAGIEIDRLVQQVDALENRVQ